MAYYTFHSFYLKAKIDGIKSLTVSTKQFGL